MATDGSDDAYERAEAHYRACLDRYGEALKARDGSAASRFEEATTAWNALYALRPIEEEADGQRHIGLAFMVAVGAGDRAEAKRHYDLLDEVWRATVSGPVKLF